MNGYNLLRDWYNYKFSHPSKVKAIHSDMYCYLIDLWNRLGQKDEFGLPTQITMEALGIGSYNTYKKTFDDLIEFGFVKLITDSKNQHQSRIVALSKNDKASDEAPDKALDKAHIKATDTIYKQETKKQQTIEERKNKFYDAIAKYVDEYPKQMLRDFFNYWTEHGEKDKKLRFEKQNTFGIEQRLRTWYNKNPKQYQSEGISPEELKAIKLGFLKPNK